MKLYVGVTDNDWYRFLSQLPNVDEVNFWQPGGSSQFRALHPGKKKRGDSGFSISMLYSVQGATFESIGRLVDRDEASLDMFWLRDETIEESDNLPDPDVLALEAEIDQLVYSLYGLTREEIAIIEESLQERTSQQDVDNSSALEEQT